MAKEITPAALRAALAESDVELRESYSGRGMYGDTCWAVVGEASECEAFERQLAKAAILDEYTSMRDDANAEDVIDDYLEMLDEIEGRRRSDSMGMAFVYYYPGIKIA